MMMTMVMKFDLTKKISELIIYQIQQSKSSLTVGLVEFSFSLSLSTGESASESNSSNREKKRYFIELIRS
jgi:hypothetical protein